MSWPGTWACALRKLRSRYRLGKTLWDNCAHPLPASLYNPQQGLKDPVNMYSLLKAKKKSLDLPVWIWCALVALKPCAHRTPGNFRPKPSQAVSPRRPQEALHPRWPVHSHGRLLLRAPSTSFNIGGNFPKEAAGELWGMP